MWRSSLWLFVAALALMLAADANAQRGRGGKRQVIVSAAVSLTDVLQQIAPIYLAKSGDQIVLNLGSSNTLARQISFGAGADVFISADEAQMNAVATRIDPVTRVDVLSNQLAIAVPDDRPRAIASARDLLDPAIRRIAIGDPAAVPAGVYAKQYLQMLGIWPELSVKMVPSGSVRLALAAVESGAADAAIVYHTDVAAAAHVREALVIPSADGPHIVYPAAMVRSGSNPEGARRFLAFLRTPEVMDIFTRAGFVVPAAAPR
jgi:molybdate transport system substrate-binding protein